MQLSIIHLNNMSLQSIIQQIKNATLPGENTALRVGSAFEQMDDAKRDISDSLSASETVDMINAVKLLAVSGTPFLGTIDPATVIPAGNFWAFAGEGSYNNAGGIVVGAGEIAIITRVDTTFDSVILDVPVKSIEDIEKTSTVGLVDTYTITYTDGSTPTTFEVTNGTDNFLKDLKFINIEKPQIANFYPLAVDSTNGDYFVRAKVANGGAPFVNLLIPQKSGGGFYFVLNERSYSKILFKQNALYGGQPYSDLGMGIGYVSANSQGYTWNASASLITFPNSPLFGKIEFKVTYGVNAYRSIYSDSALPDYEIGDYIELTFERFFHDYICVVKNLSKSSEISFRVSPKDNFENYIPFNTANPVIYIQSGDFDIFSYEYGTTLKERAEIKIDGDSITAGSNATIEPLRYASKVGDKMKNIISGGGADYTQSVLSRIDETIFLKPKVQFLMIGGNDILYNFPDATWQGNLEQICYYLTQAGIRVVLLYPTARAGAGEWIAFAQSNPTLSALEFIDTNTPTAVIGTTDELRPEYDSGDALHPNNYGMAEGVADTINAWIEANL